jgi:hypothetical protein
MGKFERLLEVSLSVFSYGLLAKVRAQEPGSYLTSVWRRK